nr:reverse transcriptase domain-containing protein [Tanacetum cinerariifolium]
IYNKRTRKIHESVNANFDEILEMASKQFSLKPGLSNLNKTGKSSNLSVSQVDEASKKDLEDLFHDFYDEYFDSSKIIKSSTTNDESSNAEVPSHEEEVFHEVSESFQGESSSSSLNDDVIDFMGQFPSSRGKKYILMAVDYLSKWVEAKALPTNDPRVVCKFLKSLFARFGTPRAIISDRGTHFFNDQFAKVMLRYGVTHRLATVYHPQTSGQVEVSNRGLKRISKRTVGENHASWSDKLDDALWAFRTAFKTPIGCTPYKLVYEKECHLPIELEHKAYWALKHCNYDLLAAGDHRKVFMIRPMRTL